MRPVPFYLLALTIFCLVCNGALAQQTEQPLSFRFDKGKTYGLSLVLNTDTESGGQKASIFMVSDFEMKVTSETDSSQVLSAIYKKLNMQIASGDFNMNGSDSDTGTAFNGDPSWLMSQMFKGLMNRPFEVEINRNGTVVRVSGIDEMADDVVKNIPVSEEIRAGMKQGFSQQFNNKAMKESLGQSFDIYPNRVVRIGDTWDRTQNNTSLGALVQTKYTVTGIDRNTVTLALRSSITMKEQNLQGIQTGTMTVDAWSGHIQQGSLEQAFDGDTIIRTKLSITGSNK